MKTFLMKMYVHFDEGVKIELKGFVDLATRWKFVLMVKRWH